MKLTRIGLVVLCLALLLCSCGDAAAAEETTAVPVNIPADGNPEDVTCKGSYTGDYDENALIASCGPMELTAGELQVWYWAQVAQFHQESQPEAPDFGAPLDAQPCEIDDSVASWQQYFLKQALNAWHSSTALSLQAEAEGVPTEEAYQPSQKNYEDYMAGMPATKFLYGYSESYQPNTMHQTYLDEIPQMLESLAKEKGYADAAAMAEEAFGASEDELRSFIHSYNYGYMYFTTLGYSAEPSEEEYEAYFAENREKYAESGNYVNIRHILLTPEESDDLEAAWQNCEQAAQKLLTKWKKEIWVTEAAFAELATENSKDAGSARNGGLYQNIWQGQLLPELDHWCFDSSRQVGDTAIFRSEQGYHILYFAGSTEAAYAAAREELLAQRQAALITAAREAYPMEADYSAIILKEAKGGISCADILYPDIAHERFPEVPLYLQQDYPQTRYGEYKITTNGCGITSLAMVASYLSDEEWTPPELCAMYGRYSHANGTDGMIFINEAAELGFYFKEKTHDVFRAKELLGEGYLVVSLQHPGYWTRGGHYIVLEKIGEDGRIQVRDSNLFNYRRIESHAEDLHSWDSIRNNGAGYWVFEKKVTAIPACSRCGDPEAITQSILQEDYCCEKCDPAILRRQVYLTALGK